MKKIFLSLFILFSFTCFSQNKNQFSLSGKTKDIPDGTVLLLKNELTDKFIDSVVVKNNTFLLRTKLPSSPLRTILFRDGSTSKGIWLENNKMTFNSTNTGFSDALITGSQTDSLIAILVKEGRTLKNPDERIALEMKFIENNPNNIASARSLSIMARAFGKKKTSELFSNMSKENKESEYGKKIAAALLISDDKTGPKIGEKYVDFAMKDQNGVEKKLSDFNGKVILLEFWASWCVPCRAENPNLINVYNKYNSQGFEIFAVSLDHKKEDWITAIQKDKLTWQQCSDLNGQNNIAASIYKVNEIPSNVLIDRNGVIIARNLRGEKLNEKLVEIMSQSTVQVTNEANGGIKMKISSIRIWKDENGKEISESEFKRLTDTQKYIPNLDTAKNTMTLQKI